MLVDFKCVGLGSNGQRFRFVVNTLNKISIIE